MDPQPLTASEWAEVGTALKFLWGALGCALIAGGSLVTAHALITSLVDTETISPRWTKMRLPLYATGLVAVAGIFICLAMAGVNMSWLDTFYARWWQ